MKIAYVSNSRFPSEKAQSDHVMAMCASFAALGHEVRLFVPERRPVMAEDPFVYYGKSKTFSFERVACVDGLRFRWLGPLGLWIQTATFTRNLSRRLAAFAPDVTYSRELYTFSRYVPGKHVWESHSLHAGNWAKRIMRSLDGIVTLTNASRDRIRAIEEDAILLAQRRVDQRREARVAFDPRDVGVDRLPRAAVQPRGLHRPEQAEAHHQAHSLGIVGDLAIRGPRHRSPTLRSHPAERRVAAVHVSLGEQPHDATAVVDRRDAPVADRRERGVALFQREVVGAFELRWDRHATIMAPARPPFRRRRVQPQA